MTYRDPHHRTESPSEVTVATYDAPHEAHLAVLHLETLGISARLLNDLVVGMAPHLGGGLGGIQVVVRETDAEEAHSALETLRLELREERGRRESFADGSHQRSTSHPRATWITTGVLVGVAVVWYLATAW